MFLLIDKPKGMTSHDVIDKIRKVTGERRVGHAGTLDPNATGLLIVGVGRESTKRLGAIAKNRKTYMAETVLGEERETDDVEGSVIGRSRLESVEISRRQIELVLEKFIGNQWQTPPAYSAVKIQGRKAYELARRKDKSLSLSLRERKRKITVYSIRLIKYQYPVLRIEGKVSSGTYMRALARDIGRKLGCGAYLNNLRRTKIGQFSVDQAIKLTELNHQNWHKFTFKDLAVEI